jgi:hypothetical protein
MVFFESGSYQARNNGNVAEYFTLGANGSLYRVHATLGSGRREGIL